MTPALARISWIGSSLTDTAPFLHGKYQGETGIRIATHMADRTGLPPAGFTNQYAVSLCKRQEHDFEAETWVYIAECGYERLEHGCSRLRVGPFRKWVLIL